MIYQDLEKMLQSLADKSELWDKLNGAVLDLADKNFGYLQIMVSVFGILIGVAVYFRWETRKDFKEYEKELEEHKNKLKKQEEEIIKNEKNLADLEENLQKQTVEIKWSAYGENKGITRFISFAYYIKAEGEFHKLYGKFIKEENFEKIYEKFMLELDKFWEELKKRKEYEYESYKTDAVSAFEDALCYFCKHPSFKDEADGMVEQIKKGDEIDGLCRDIRDVTTKDEE